MVSMIYKYPSIWREVVNKFWRTPKNPFNTWKNPRISFFGETTNSKALSNRLQTNNIINIL